MHVQLTNWAMVSKKCFQLLGAAVPCLCPAAFVILGEQGESLRASLVCWSLTVKGKLRKFYDPKF